MGRKAPKDAPQKDPAKGDVETVDRELERKPNKEKPHAPSASSRPSAAPKAANAGPSASPPDDSKPFC